MKISQKLRNAILNEISNVMMEEQDRQCGDLIKSPPDLWPEHVKEKYDELTDLNIRLEKRVDSKILCS